MAAYVPTPPAPARAEATRRTPGFISSGRMTATGHAPSHYPRLPDYPLSGYYVHPSPFPFFGAEARPGLGHRIGFRGPRMYTGGYRGFSYRGGMW